MKIIGSLLVIVAFVALGLAAYPYLIKEQVEVRSGSINGIAVNSSAQIGMKKAEEAGYKYLLSSCRNEEGEAVQVDAVERCPGGNFVVVLQKGFIFQRILRLYVTANTVDRIELVRTMDSL